MSHSQPTPTNEQVGQLFSEIAGSAEAINSQWFHFPADQSNPGALHTLINQMHEAVMRIGWIADKGAELLGNSQVRGGAEEWMLSPALNDALHRVTTDDPS